MSELKYIRTLINENVDKESVVWCDYSSELDDVAYLLLMNYLFSDSFLSLLKNGVGSENDNISFSTLTQEKVIQLHLEKSNNGIENIYYFAKGYLRKIKLELVNNTE